MSETHKKPEEYTEDDIANFTRDDLTDEQLAEVQQFLSDRAADRLRGVMSRSRDSMRFMRLSKLLQAGNFYEIAEVVDMILAEDQELAYEVYPDIDDLLEFIAEVSTNPKVGSK